MRKRHTRRLRLTAVVVVAVAVSMLASACFGDRKGDASIRPGTVYSIGFDGSPVVSYDAGHAYAVDSSGKIMLTYRQGAGEANVATAPLALDMEGDEPGMAPSEIGVYVSPDKTAIVYGFADGGSQALHVLISDDSGRTWNDYEIPGSKGYDTKLIGFSTDQDGWIVAGATQGVGQALNHIYFTSDGGKTWREIGNPNEVYAEHVTGAGFSDNKTGFVGFRYYEDNGPVIYWTRDQGRTWERLEAELPAKYEDYRKNPLSPLFDGNKGTYPIAMRDSEGIELGTIYLVTEDYGLTWKYEPSLDALAGK